MKTRAREIGFLLPFLLLLTVSASAAIKQEIPDLKPPREEVAPEDHRSDVLPWFIAGGVAAILVAIASWPREAKRPLVETPAATAWRELQTAKEPQVVSQILRRYLLAAFPLPGEGASTEEISDCLFTHIPSDPTLAHQVTEFLLACDTEKFAPLTGAAPEAAAAAAGWAPKTTEETATAPGSAAEVALSLIDKMEKRRRRPVHERAL